MAGSDLEGAQPPRRRHSGGHGRDLVRLGSEEHNALLAGRHAPRQGSLRATVREQGVETYDYIIVGAGSAGCVLADRLTACGRHSVLLVEAGGSDRHLSVRLPIGYGRAFHDARINWRYRTEAEAELGGRSLYWPRGRVLGGSSAINALVYIR